MVRRLSFGTICSPRLFLCWSCVVPGPPVVFSNHVCPGPGPLISVHRYSYNSTDTGSEPNVPYLQRMFTCSHGTCSQSRQVPDYGIVMTVSYTCTTVMKLSWCPSLCDLQDSFRTPTRLKLIPTCEPLPLRVVNPFAWL